MNRILLIVLMLSLSLNAWFFLKISEQATPHGQDNTTSVTEAPATTNTTNTVSEPLTENKNTEHSNLPFSASEHDQLKQLHMLYNQQRYEELEIELREFLFTYPNNQEGLLLEAAFFLKTETLNYALTHYYELLSKSLDPEHEKSVRLVIQQQTTNVIQQLTGDHAWEILATFLEPLLQMDPLNKQYILALARAYGMLEQATLMENVLASLRADHPRAIKLREEINNRLSKQGIRTQSSDTALVDIDLNGSEFQNADVVARLTERNQMFATIKVAGKSLRMLLDTGASTTAIKQSIIDAMPDSAMNFVGNFNVQTAAGMINAPLYRLTEIELGRVTFSNTSVLVLPNDTSEQFDGLLGMNLLKDFEMSFDQSTQRMMLFKRQNP